MPTAAEKLIWGQGSASDVKVIPATLSPTTTVQTSAAICWENFMPLHRYALYRLGTELYCAPTVDGRDSWQITMRHIAFEGRCFVLSACQFSRQKVRVCGACCWSNTDPASPLPHRTTQTIPTLPRLTSQPIPKQLS